MEEYLILTNKGCSDKGDGTRGQHFQQYCWTTTSLCMPTNKTSLLWKACSMFTIFVRVRQLTYTIPQTKHSTQYYEGCKAHGDFWMVHHSRVRICISITVGGFLYFITCFYGYYKPIMEEYITKKL